MTDSTLRVGPDADPDRYKLGVVAGSGAEGILYRGTISTSSGLELEVAVKMLQPRHLRQVDQWRERWEEQVEILRSLHSPGAVAVRDGFVGSLPHPAGEPGTGRTLYLVMNWVDGETLDDWVRRQPDGNPLDALQPLLAVAAALDLMHSGRATNGVPVVHRDVKPSNILLVEDSSVLVDFGLTRSLPGGLRLTGVAGTPGYLAPESVGEGRYTGASDRYAFGAVVYFVLTGTEVSAAPDPATLRRGLLEIADLAGRGQVVDRVMAMLASDPEDRPGALANWLGQLRGSSLPDLTDVTAPLRSLRQGPEHSLQEPATSLTGSTAQSGSRIKRRAVAGILATVIVVSLIVATASDADQRIGRTTQIASSATTTLPTTPTTVTVVVPPPVSPVPSSGLTCENDYLGYQIQLPPGVTPAPDGPVLGPCETLDFGPSGNDIRAGLVTAPIVFATINRTLSSFQSGRPADAHSSLLGWRTTTVAGEKAIVIEDRLTGDDLFFTAGTRSYAYVVEDPSRPVLLVAELQASSTTSDTEYLTQKHSLDTIMQTLRLLTPRNCHDSKLQKCGDFYWSPAPLPWVPVKVTVVPTPPDPLIGETVILNVRASDPYADKISCVAGGTSYLPYQGGGDLITYARSRYAGGPNGPWKPPPPEPGTYSTTFTTSYPSPGSYTAEIECTSMNSKADGIDPYGAGGSGSATVNVSATATTSPPSTSPTVSTAVTIPTTTNVSPTSG